MLTAEASRAGKAVSKETLSSYRAAGSASSHDSGDFSPGAGL